MNKTERMTFVESVQKLEKEIAKLKQELEAIWKHVKPSKREPYSGNFS